MRIQPVEKEQASEAVRSAYEAIERRGGRVSTFYKMLGHTPEVLRTFAAFYQAIWAPGGAPAKAEGAGLPAHVDPERLCILNPRPHRFGKRQGLMDEQIAALNEPGSRRRTLFSPEEQAVLRFTDLLTSYPGNIDQADIEALAVHFSQEQIVELALTIATANLTNRINEELQTPLG